jgi:nicotinate dehydrogenase subunit A
MSDARSFTLHVNGETQSVTAEPETPLLYILRNDLGLVAAKYGCGQEQCGACSVIVDGERAFSCVYPLEKAAGRAITTLEGIGTPENPHPLQKAFEAEQAVQCGYCTSGIIVAAKALLDRNPDPDLPAIRLALQDNLCRCGTHSRVLRAVRRAAQEMAQEKAGK